MRNRLAAGLAGTMLVAALAACSSGATFTQVPGKAYAELDGLDGTAEADYNLSYRDVVLDVELEEGTVDVEVVDLAVFHNEDDTEDVMELDVIYSVGGVSSGDHLAFSDDDGTFRFRVTSSDGAKGTITFSEG